MSNSERPADAGGAALVKRALAALQDLRLKYERLERARQEPIAIVGIGCRFPGGAESPSQLWEMLREGRDAIAPIPPHRWDLNEYFSPDPEAAGKMTMRFGGFLPSVDAFDPYFFGIAPREACAMDPQQRLFLEVAYHALEDAGVRLEELAGSDAGVFVGANSTDYLQLQLAEPSSLDTYSLTGGVGCIIANRLSYLLDLRGPSLTVDTACSSSLVALHQACLSLRAGESSLAIVGGMNVLLSPVMSMAHAKGLPLAPDGRCKSFDARADGYVRGEGVGVVVLKRLSDAEASGDRVWAVIYGSAVNQDGLSNGLTAPNGMAQRAVIRRALANAGLSGREISFVEAHGTGTALGDPIEVEGLKEIYGRAEPGCMPCALGTIKTNIGHLEAGAGIAGLIKAALALKHGAIPANLHFETLNPHLSLEDSRLFVPTRLTPWAGPRYAAVSSFGAGGTNAHVILGSPEVSRGAGVDVARDVGERNGADEAQLLVLSARSHAALLNLARRFEGLLTAASAESIPLADFCTAAALRRTHHKHRLGLLVVTAKDAAEKLRSFIGGSPSPEVASATVGESALAESQEAELRRQLLARDGTEEGRRKTLRAARDLFVRGASVALADVMTGSWKDVDLPLYPFDHEPYWYKERPAGGPHAPLPLGAASDTVRRKPADTAPLALPPELDDLRMPSSGREESPHSALPDVRSIVHAEVARVLRFNPARLDPRRGFFDLGMDSIMAAQLRNHLERAFGRKLQTSLIIERPSVEALSEQLCKLMSGTTAKAAPSRRAPVNEASRGVPKRDPHDDLTALLAEELDQI